MTVTNGIDRRACAAAIEAAVMPVSLGSLLALWVGITDGRFLQAA